VPKIEVLGMCSTKPSLLFLCDNEHVNVRGDKEIGGDNNRWK